MGIAEGIANFKYSTDVLSGFNKILVKGRFSHSP
jgi:hypothetical protein